MTEQNRKHIVTYLKYTSYGCSKRVVVLVFPQFQLTVFTFYSLDKYYTGLEVGCQVKYPLNRGFRGFTRICWRKDTRKYSHRGHRERREIVKYQKAVSWDTDLHWMV